MNNVLKEYLRITFYRSNIKKYHKYFEEWVDNITDEQIKGFENQRIGIITDNKIQH